MTTTSVYTISSDGVIDLKTTFLPQGVLPELPRLGLAFCLAPAYNTFTWYGRGPQDNYPRIARHLLQQDSGKER